MPSYKSDDVVPLLATRPATWVPCPYGSCALTFFPFELRKSYVAVTFSFAFGRMPESMMATCTLPPEYGRGRSASVFSRTSFVRYDVPSVRTIASDEIRATSPSRCTASSCDGFSSATSRFGLEVSRMTAPARAASRCAAWSPAPGRSVISVRTDALVGCAAHSRSARSSLLEEAFGGAARQRSAAVATRPTHDVRKRGIAADAIATDVPLSYTTDRCC